MAISASSWFKQMHPVPPQQDAPKEQTRTDTIQGKNPKHSKADVVVEAVVVAVVVIVAVAVAVVVVVIVAEAVAAIVVYEE